MGAPAEFLTVRQVAAATGWPAPTVRWHCRHPRGMLVDLVTRLRVGPEGRTTTYLIPASQVEPLKAARREYLAWRRMQDAVVSVYVEVSEGSPLTLPETLS